MVQEWPKDSRIITNSKFFAKIAHFKTESHEFSKCAGYLQIDYDTFDYIIYIWPPAMIFHTVTLNTTTTQCDVVVA